MREKSGKNCVYVGSFNPVHIGHVSGIEEILDLFETACVFVRYNEGVDLVDWETKAGWFENISREHEGRVRYYKEVSEEKGKNYGIELFFDFIRKTEKVIGEKVDGFYFGSDYKKILPLLEAEFPDKKFVFGDRTVGVSSTVIRNDPEGHRDLLPPYVYESLKRKARKDD